jgi:hypothetical protein
MAATYDNVCGNKGYSYDAYQFNIRGIKNNVTKPGYNIDSISIAIAASKGNNGTHKGVRGTHFDRGRVGKIIMNEIGYENCDYISHETKWTFWPNLMNELNNINNNQNNNNNNNNITLELHVPCREPLQHLMSMASHFHKKYICDENETKITIEKAIHKVYMNHLGDMRFSNKLLNTNANENANANANNNIELKCFNPFPLENYINYMSDKLQHRRFYIPKYVKRDTNAKHSKSSECIWDSTSEEYKQKVIQLLINKHPYMKFCYDCIGSNNELQLLQSQSSQSGVSSTSKSSSKSSSQVSTDDDDDDDSVDVDVDDDDDVDDKQP